MAMHTIQIRTGSATVSILTALILVMRASMAGAQSWATYCSRCGHDDRQRQIALGKHLTYSSNSQPCDWIHATRSSRSWYLKQSALVAAAESAFGSATSGGAKINCCVKPSVGNVIQSSLN
jgi:hypothetical protein